MLRSVQIIIVVTLLLFVLLCWLSCILLSLLVDDISKWVCWRVDDVIVVEGLTLVDSFLKKRWFSVVEGKPFSVEVVPVKKLLWATTLESVRERKRPLDRSQRHVVPKDDHGG